MPVSETPEETPYLLEICANSIQSARNAQRAGAHRIELCQSLDVGGITPSIGLIRRVKQELSIPVHVLVRPRPGDFIYDDDEFQIMSRDIEACRALNCEGIAVGVLDENYHVHISRMQQLVEAANPMQVTFHRAFDDCEDQHRALEDIIATKCTRILTSGGAGSALEGSMNIAALKKQAQDRIIVLPAGGINATNVQIIAADTGVSEFHASATKNKSDIHSKHLSRFYVEQLESNIQSIRDLIGSLESMSKLEDVRTL